MIPGAERACHLSNAGKKLHALDVLGHIEGLRMLRNHFREGLGVRVYRLSRFEADMVFLSPSTTHLGYSLSDSSFENVSPHNARSPLCDVSVPLINVLGSDTGLY